ncbi:MAG: DEAD/DEAH box helicase family protein [Candidatus Magasanikbacteria bacterium]|nr:DEAD/DEAH box helicase family protein [Candidatus Magasanikbacteria bacterium]
MANSKEAKARIKINKLLEEAGWRFFSDEKGPANIQLEPNVKITKKEIDAFGEDFESTKSGFIDFLLLDEKGFPLVVLEAKKEEKDPLDGKEQARRYAQSQNIRFVLLSNGNLHYFWDLERGNPEIITEFPTQESLLHRLEFKPDNKRLADERVEADYIAMTQNPNYKEDPRYQDESTREQYLRDEGLPILRPYQLKAIQALQRSAEVGNDRFLFEMATGTGKTLVSGAAIKLFLRTGNAKRILFLVDRLELKDQAYKSFVRYLKNDYTSVIYKQNRDDWKKAEIVISTVQSLSSQDKYKKLFSPTDFDLVISDEAHRSIGGNSRAVFEYFVGYKLGLTATPKDYLKNIDPQKLSSRDPRAWERRQLLDTYTTFGCPSSEPTYRYTLLDGVKDGYLVNPVTVDARTDITTELLSEKGYAVMVENEEGGEIEETFFQRDFEKKFFSDKTNQVFCKTIIENALRDPISGEIGKTLVFCVSQKHASKITQVLNQMAHQIWPDKYNSDFAVQITSNIQNSQQMTINFANNNLNGHTKFLPGYKSSKTRVCVTVGMMTTGYDCEDILNLALLRPVFSPTDFVQIKGRGTRRFTFEYKNEDGEVQEIKKDRFKFFDFFANFEYFEEKFDYDEALCLPIIKRGGQGEDERVGVDVDEIEIFDPDKIKQLTETPVGTEGMKIDRKLFEEARKKIKKDEEVKRAVNQEQWEKAVKILRDKYENKPELYLNLEKIRKSENLDRRLSWREFLERVFGFIDTFKSKDEKLEEEVEKFISIYKPESKYVPYIRNYLKAYIADDRFREIINSKHFGELNFYPGFSFQEFQALNGWRDIVPEYVKDYVSVNQYMR